MQEKEIGVYEDRLTVEHVEQLEREAARGFIRVMHEIANKPDHPAANEPKKGT